MLTDMLFYLIFISQILLVSKYYPKQILNRLKYLFENYPPEKYPKLYTKNLEHYKKKENTFRILNKSIMVMGFIILIGLVVWDYYYDQNIPTFIPFLYFMIQVAPIIKMEISKFAYFNLIRNIDSSTIRKAELQPRRLFNFISPLEFSLAVLFYFSCIIYFLYIFKF